MAKPKAIQWLEEQTGESIDFTPEPDTAGRDRHLSVRVPSELADRLAADVAEVRRRLAG
jgi:hypothetical protein